MAKAVFYPSGFQVDVQDGITVLEAARQAGLAIEAPCNGVLVCGKCKVMVRSGKVEHTGLHLLSPDEVNQGYALSCGAKICGDVEIDVLSNEEKGLKIVSKGKSLETVLNPNIKKVYKSNENETEIYAGGSLAGIEEGDTSHQNYGVVVDIGTTTLVASIIDLNTGSEIGSESALNPQAVHAQDVLSRIKFASDGDGLKNMQNAVISEINNLIEKTADTINKEHIYEIVLSGNTCMLHLAAGVNPYSLGKYPYVSEINDGSSLSAKELGIEISPFGTAYLPPIVSAYVGADITSGILAADLEQQNGVTLFVDIGTNGEMVIAHNGFLSATSTAAGPAFEGMNINCGMRAAAGAIEYFEIEDDGNIEVRTIGNTAPTGICGSGLLDIVGELVAHKIIGANGKFANPENIKNERLRQRLISVEGKKAFQVDGHIVITQKDVRQVQLAKGAVRAGIELLLRSKEVSSQMVDRVQIAGSFGYHLRAKSLINIGLLPGEFEGKIEFVGNTSKTGGHAFLINKALRNKMKNSVGQIEVVELADFKDFDRIFVECLSF